MSNDSVHGFDLSLHWAPQYEAFNDILLFICMGGVCLGLLTSKKESLLSRQAFLHFYNSHLFWVVSVRELHNGEFSGHLDCCVFPCDITGIMNLFEQTGLCQLHADRGYSTYESKTAVLLNTHLNSTHWNQVLFTVVKGCQRLYNTPLSFRI